ncbi:MAG: hypothetical protein A3B44_01675 [Candidatus Levybacteria bacterium RIFCSPLOWO2_01_FULL_38_21]|nr:MAG: hypothetical protein A3B44_01675 [Candidatus Levybacteria bacterium RIFCSPLOWO2_01_FULL_38_21]
MNHSKSLLNNGYQLVFLLSDLGFPISNNLFGQLTIAIDLCRFAHKDFKEVDIYILTSGTYTKTCISKNIRVIHTNDPFIDPSAYKRELGKILKNKKPTIATSFMIHRDAAAVYELSKLKKTFSNLLLLIGLYCTAREYFYDELPIRNFISQKAKDYILAKNKYTAAMKRYLTMMLNENSIDKYLVLNEYTKKAYLAKELRRIIPPDKIYVIRGGADEKLFKPITNKQKMLIRKKYMLDERKFILCFGTRFTQYKGADILEEILNYYNNNIIAPTFLFPLYPNSDTVLLSNKLLGYKKLLEKNKIKFFLDLSRQKCLLQRDWPTLYKKTCLDIDSFIKNLPTESKKYIEKNYLGVLDFPYYHLANIVLRPSIADSQAITLFESALCNCPAYGTNRTGFYHDLDELREYSVKLPSNIQIFNRYSDYKTHQYNDSVKSVAEEFVHMINKEMENFEKKLDPVHTRELVIRNGFTSKAMVKRHVQLYKSLFANL